MATIVEISASRCIQPSSKGIRQHLEDYRRTLEFAGAEDAARFMQELRALADKYPAMDPRSVAGKESEEGTFSSSVV